MGFALWSCSEHRIPFTQTSGWENLKPGGFLLWVPRASGAQIPCLSCWVTTGDYFELEEGFLRVGLWEGLMWEEGSVFACWSRTPRGPEWLRLAGSETHEWSVWVAGWAGLICWISWLMVPGAEVGQSSKSLTRKEWFYLFFYLTFKFYFC